VARRSRVLLVYNRDYGPGGGPKRGEEARAGVLKTAQAAEKALAKLADVELTAEGVDSPAALVELLDREGPFDVAVNLCESLRGDPRYEIPVPVLLEARGIDYTGNPPFALRQCLDKGTARETLAAAGVPVPAGGVIRTREDLPRLLPGMPVPAIVKPGREDGSIGIEAGSVVRDPAALERRARFVLGELGQPAVVEAFVDGREFNVSILGDLEPRALPIAEIDFSGMPAGVPRIVSYKAKWHERTPEYKGTVPVFGSTDEALARRLRKAALGAFRALSLRDYARVDLRVDREGNPYVVDVNPNCDLAPDAGFPRAAAKDGMDYEALLQTILGFALARRARRPAPRAPSPPKAAAKPAPAKSAKPASKTSRPRKKPRASKRRSA
jgi:D-alanine-D-alanine ligase